MSRLIEFRLAIGLGLAVPILISVVKYLQSSKPYRHPIPSSGTNEPTEKKVKKDQVIRPLNISPEDVENYHGRPWRPFRWPHNQTMALLKLDLNYWLDVTPDYKRFLQERKELFENYDKEKLKTTEYFFRLEEFDEEFIELRDYVINLMCSRYPKLFIRHKNVIENKLTNEMIDLETEDPLLAVTKVTMEDFYIVQKKEDGLNYCVGASVCFGGGGFGILPLKNQSLDEIHTPVPYYQSKLKPSMEKWFTKFTDPVERASWHIVWDDYLNCSEFYPVMRNMSHDEVHEYVKSIPYTKFLCRLDQQSLIKLPKTKAIIFTNHPKFVALKDLADEPLMPHLILKMLYEAPQDIIKYRHFEVFRDYLSIYLNELIDKQVEQGLVPKDVNVRTTESYPFATWMNDVFTTEENGWIKPEKPKKMPV